MDIFIQGKGKIKLSDKDDFLAGGGEGNVYGKSGVIYKIYHDNKPMIPIGKIKELQAIQKDNILYPKDLILNTNNKPIGFTMDWIKNTSVLCQLFPSNFLSRNNIKLDDLLTLMQNIQRDIQHIHSRNCIIVDLNELNILVGKGFILPYFIDVDSYMTSSYPPTAQMLSIKDWHTNGYNQLTDWFAFAILSCQLLIGIHPFKGGHPNYRNNDFQNRMQDNISIFNNKAQVPSSTRDFSNIPSNYKEWFIKLFEKGERLEPPTIIGDIKPTTAKITVVKSTNKLNITLIKKYDEKIKGVFIVYNKTVIIFNDYILLDNVRYNRTKENKADVIVTSQNLMPLEIYIKNDVLVLTNLKTGLILNTSFSCEEFFTVNETVYIKNNKQLTKLEIREIGDKILVGYANMWEILPNASKMFRKVVYINTLGKHYFMMPTEDGSMLSYLIKELNGYKIIDAKFNNGVLVIIAFKDSDYHKFIFKVADYCKLKKSSVIQSQDDFNFITLDNGLIVYLNSGDELELFSMNYIEEKLIQDSMLLSDMRLVKDGNRVLFYKGDSLYQLSMVK